MAVNGLVLARPEVDIAVQGDNMRADSRRIEQSRISSEFGSSTMEVGKMRSGWLPVYWIRIGNSHGEPLRSKLCVSVDPNIVYNKETQQSQKQRGIRLPNLGSS